MADREYTPTPERASIPLVVKSSNRTLRSKKLRALLWYHYGGKCAICGCDLPEDWHADHIKPWTKTKRTNIFEIQALCPECNLRKGDKDV